MAKWPTGQLVDNSQGSVSIKYKSRPLPAPPPHPQSSGMIAKQHFMPFIATTSRIRGKSLLCAAGSTLCCLSMRFSFAFMTAAAAAAAHNMLNTLPAANAIIILTTLVLRPLLYPASPSPFPFRPSPGACCDSSLHLVLLSRRFVLASFCSFLLIWRGHTKRRASQWLKCSAEAEAEKKKKKNLLEKPNEMKMKMKNINWLLWCGVQNYGQRPFKPNTRTEPRTQ